MQEISTEKMKVSFKGFALGDSWISPVDSVNSWSSYLFDLVSCTNNIFNKYLSY
jgi:hypothetical protein